MGAISYMENLQNVMQMNLFTKQKQTYRLWEQHYGYGGGQGQRGGSDGECGLDIYTRLYLKQMAEGPAEQHRELCSNIL